MMVSESQERLNAAGREGIGKGWGRGKEFEGEEGVRKGFRRDKERV